MTDDILRTTDNNRGKTLDKMGSDNRQETVVDLRAIADKTISELLKENPGLLIFPPESGKYHDEIEKLRICSLNGKELTTYNLMGFVGRNGTQLTISSRFTPHHDYFLHYMLGKVLSVNVVNLDTHTNDEGIEDFLPYLFPVYLKRALSQGIYKEYRRNEYNDTNIRGVIDVSKNIRLNIPFAGKVAYHTREYGYDNTITELIRHTIEHMKTLPMFENILTVDPDVRSDVQQIMDCTRSYGKGDRRKIITANLKPIHHPYYTEYLPLQHLCLQILSHEKVSFGTDKDKIHGLIFDGAWLWEEYLNSILWNEYDHPRNKTKEGKQHLFKIVATDEKEQEIYPDFIAKDNSAIADAKYKHLDDKNREDYFQLIAYMYRFKAKNGFLLFPCCSKNNNRYRFEIIGTDGKLTKLGLPIPQNVERYEWFCDDMNKGEELLQQELLEGKE